jgi:hypothetical protein
MEDMMGALSPYHDVLDEIFRDGHRTYLQYDALHRIEHDARAQASCIYSHLVAAADRRLLDETNILTKEIRNLKVWIFKDQDLVIRFKKMDQDGLSQNYRTKQQQDYDAGLELPGLPSPPLRLTVGYLLDRTNSQYIRTQIAQPSGSSVDWCAAIVSLDQREVGEPSWIDVTREKRAAI